METYTNTQKLKLTDNALKVLEKRYLRKEASGQVVETPDEMFLRVARNISNAEQLYNNDEKNRQQWENRFLNLMASGEFLFRLAHR